jgi:hypothetical protein
MCGWKRHGSLVNNLHFNKELIALLNSGPMVRGPPFVASFFVRGGPYKKKNSELTYAKGRRATSQDVNLA